MTEVLDRHAAPSETAPGPRTPATPWRAHPTGRLRLRFGLRGGRTVAVEEFHAGALRVLRAHYPDATGQPSYTVINPGGGYLGGDDYETVAVLDPGASALLTTQSATRIYRTPQGPAVAVQRFELGAGSRLEVVPDGVIAYRGATYRQDTVVHMAPDASLALADVLTHGWSPDGEPFSFDEVSVTARVSVDGRLAVADNLLLRPALGGAGPLMLAGHSHVASLLVVDPRAHDGAVAALRALVAETVAATGAGPAAGQALVGISALAVPGFALRALTGSTQDAEAILHAVLNWMRREWHGQPPLGLRKL